MAMEIERKNQTGGKRVRFVFEADPAYGPVVDALCKRYLVGTSELLRRLVVDDARRIGINLEQLQAEVEELEPA